MLSRAKVYLKVLGAGGLAFAIRQKLTGEPKIFTVRRADCRHPIYLRIPSSDTPTFQQVFVDREYDFSVEKEPRVIVDAGANIGMASVFFANRFPSAKIIAIEPEQGNFEMLQKNVAEYPNVIAVQGALWNRNEEINLVDPGLGEWGFMTETRDGKAPRVGKPRHVVKAMTVARIMADFQLPAIDILKIDIEGAEKEVFSDTSEWIDKVSAIIIELHERMKAGCNRSFYHGSAGFETEWTQGENVYLSRGRFIRRRSLP